MAEEKQTGVKETEKVADAINNVNPWDISESKAEIQVISETAAEMVHDAYPELDLRANWEGIPRITLTVMTSLLNQLKTALVKTQAPVSWKFGRLMTIEIQWAEFTKSDKAGSLNPAYFVGEELSYETKDVPYNDAITASMAKELEKMGTKYLPAQFYDDAEFYKKVSDEASRELLDWGIIVLDDWGLPLLITEMFFRAAKKYFIDNKDQSETGCSMKFAELFEMGVDIDGPVDDPGYEIYIKSERVSKMDKAKADNVSEKNED